MRYSVQGRDQETKSFQDQEQDRISSNTNVWCLMLNGSTSQHRRIPTQMSLKQFQRLQEKKTQNFHLHSSQSSQQQCWMLLTFWRIRQKEKNSPNSLNYGQENNWICSVSHTYFSQETFSPLANVQLKLTLWMQFTSKEAFKTSLVEISKSKSTFPKSVTEWTLNSSRRLGGEQWITWRNMKMSLIWFYKWDSLKDLNAHLLLIINMNMSVPYKC